LRDRENRMNRLRTERERQGLSGRELAHFAETSPMTISRLERGEGDVAPAVKARVARVLRVPVDQLWPSDGASEEAAGTKEVNPSPAAA
jgi:transcriptional regulator with XRE-family HTH domain